MEEYIIKAGFGQGARPMYIASETSLSHSRTDAKKFPSEKECEEAAASEFFDTVMSFEFLPAHRKK